MYVLGMSPCSISYVFALSIRFCSEEDDEIIGGPSQGMRIQLQSSRQSYEDTEQSYEDKNALLLYAIPQFGIVLVHSGIVAICELW